MRSILLYGKPIFGVYDSPSSFSSITFNSALKAFNFSNGQVFFNTNLVTVPSQNISVQDASDVSGLKYYKFYLDYNDFILASTIFSSTIIAVFGNSITVSQLPTQQYLNNFNQLNLNGYIIKINSIDSNTNVITLSQDVSLIAFLNNTVNFIFQPTIKTLVTTASVGNPANINIPDSGIILASAYISVDNIGNYSLVGTIQNLFVAYPQYLNPVSFFPSQAAYNAFLVSIGNSIRIYNNVQTYDIEASLVDSFINYTNNIQTTATSFDAYWHSQPYSLTEFFQYGTGFQGLQKPDFDKRFKDFWFFYQNVDLTRTLAIFRGDIYGGNSHVGKSLGIFPGSINVNNYIDYSNKSSLNTGTYSYGVSAVTPSGEYVPVYIAATNNFFNQKVNNYISWTTPTISNLLFYHVYRNALQTNGYNLERITNPFSVTNSTLADVILPSTGSQGIGSSNFAIKIKNSDSISGLVGGLYFNASITDNTALTGIQSCLITNSGLNYVAPFVVISGSGTGASISISTNASGGIGSVLVTSIGSGYISMPVLTVFDSQSNTAGGAILQPIPSQLNCGIYTGNSSNPIGTSMAQLSPVNIFNINSGNLQTPIDMGLSTGNFVGLNTNTDYWAVFTMNTPYALNENQNIKFASNSGFSTAYATSNNLVNWSTGTTNCQIAKLGFIDQGKSGNLTSSNGVFLTNDKCVVPLRLQLYIPNMDLSSATFANFGAGISTVILPIQNSMTVYVLAKNSQTGIQSTLVGNVPRGTARNTSILLGSSTDVFDQVLNVLVQPNLNLGVNFITNTTLINWSIFDLFTVDSAP